MPRVEVEDQQKSLGSWWYAWDVARAGQRTGMADGDEPLDMGVEAHPTQDGNLVQGGDVVVIVTRNGYAEAWRHGGVVVRLLAWGVVVVVAAVAAPVRQRVDGDGCGIVQVHGDGGEVSAGRDGRQAIVGGLGAGWVGVEVGVGIGQAQGGRSEALGGHVEDAPGALSGVEG